MSRFGVHSEVGKLRKVIVHRPGLEMRRLTPSNAGELLFDDVIWVRKARQHHNEFVDLKELKFENNSLVVTKEFTNLQIIGALYTFTKKELKRNF